MLEMARTDGAVIHEGMQLTAMTTDEDGADLVFDNETFRAKHVIAADGMWSPVRKFLGLSIDGYRGEWHAFRQYFENVSRGPPPNSSSGSKRTCSRATPGRSRSRAIGRTSASGSSEAASTTRWRHEDALA